MDDPQEGPDSSYTNEELTEDDVYRLGNASVVVANPSVEWKKFWQDKICNQDVTHVTYSSQWVKDQPSEFKLTFDHRAGRNLGVDVAIGEGKYLQVNAIFTGTVDDFNKKNPIEAVKVGDRIFEVNGINKATQIARECGQKKPLKMTFSRPYDSKAIEGGMEIHLRYKDNPQCREMSYSYRVNLLKKNGACKPIHEVEGTFEKTSLCALAAVAISSCSKGVIMHTSNGHCHCCDSSDVEYTRSLDKIQECRELIEPYKSKCMLLAGEIRMYQIDRIPGINVHAPTGPWPTETASATEEPQGDISEQRIQAGSAESTGEEQAGNTESTEAQPEESLEATDAAYQAALEQEMVDPGDTQEEAQLEGVNVDVENSHQVELER
eukprot:gnl/MRDRNA2_/MRDRNA2_76139_c0_seq2.p1 gnl/MRDRNA2_/MRDRNA2_76139_c0~~gnl/MRDRNA2_/MRDRNA2_76139_c0_seq2.p1  ORF type:complete len:379 (-),score=81.55 gnl/MRDRNA2_/MRDRNA2_76139_c0_seq2:27-1163(-)